MLLESEREKVLPQELQITVVSTSGAIGNITTTTTTTTTIYNVTVCCNCYRNWYVSSTMMTLTKELWLIIQQKGQDKHRTRSGQQKEMNHTNNNNNNNNNLEWPRIEYLLVVRTGLLLAHLSTMLKNLSSGPLNLPLSYRSSI